ncbi:PREDICTED: pyridoxal kinase [Polistes canadensis]|uniref:pyridoxal kinase n=1 Tax=Polistes canadensis TaxID=91411 RepID=UPI0007190459|nr:PREDICTED: pyridoxal kinase [Polistes canadensis]
MNSKKIPRILSIQSHVVSGYVGNKSATFPLQLLGFEVDAINSVQLSNHTGYKAIKGQVLNDKDIDDLVYGLAENNLDHYTHLLTGYVGSASFLKRIAALVQTLRRKNPNLIYVCDPVMGDNGQMYVPKELKDIYKNEIVPLADIVTPNQFETELLTGKSANNLNELRTVIKELHKMGPQTVAVSSVEMNNCVVAVISSLKDDILLKIDIPKIPSTFTGSGDLFAALFLAHTYLQENIKTATEKTINSLQGVLCETFRSFQEYKDDGAQFAQKIELRLIQSKRHIEDPEIKLRAEFL